MSSHDLEAVSSGMDMKPDEVLGGLVSYWGCGDRCCKEKAQHYVNIVIAKSNIAALREVKDNHPIVSGFHSDCHICDYIDNQIKRLEDSIARHEEKIGE